MNTVELLSELSSTYVILKPSSIEGIGVVAIQRIPKGCREMFSKPNAADKWIKLPKKEVSELPAHTKFLVENYCLYDQDNYFVPDYGFKKMDVSLFLNHSDTPNVISIHDGEYFEATRDIEAGEELLIDYGGIVDHE
jgi:SET domain-containing protein